MPQTTVRPTAFNGKPSTEKDFIMSQVLFFTATAAQYAALATKDSSALYFITDQNRIYKGDAPFTHPTELVSAFPASGNVGTLYIHQTTYEAKTWDGSAWSTASLPVVTAIDVSPTNTQLPTAQAVKNYVDAEIVNVNSGISGVVSNVGYVEASKSLSVQKGTSAAVVTQLQGFVDGASFNGATGVLSFTTNGGTPITVNLPVEQFLSAAAYDDATNTLTLTLNNGTTFDVDLADLVDTHTGGSSTSVDIAIAGGTITATAKVSATEGNQLSIKSDGLYVPATDISAKMSKVSGTAGTILTADATGNAVRTDKKIVTTLTNLDTDVPTTKAVTAVTSAIDTKATDAGTAATTAQTTANSKMAKVAAAANGQVIVASATGDASASGNIIGGATLAATPSASTLATEAAVAAALTWQNLG